MGFKDYLFWNEPESLNEKVLNIGNKSRSYPKSGQILVLAGGAGCFDGDTLIKTVDGYKKISEITTDDKVYSYNETTKMIEIKDVESTHTFDDHPENILKLEFENGETVICTESHEFFIDGEWIKARDLK